MEKLKPRAVIFDLGSTLIEYEASTCAALSAPCAAEMRRLLVKQGYDVPAEPEFYRALEAVKEEFRRDTATSLNEWTISKAAEKLLARLEIESGDGLVDRMFDAYYKPFDAQLYAYDDTIDTLEKIRSKVDVMGLVSNTTFPERVHRKELKRFGLEKYLDFAVFSSSFGLRKPHPDIFYHAVNLAGCAPAEAVYVGDRFVEDYQGPTAIGMSAVLKIWPGREYPPDIPASVPKISCLAELANYLDI